jgi:4-hydroxy-tetrahydrodipicolinate synthase
MFKGSLVALITPFRDGAVDETAFQEHAAWQLGQGTHGLVPIGTTGECPALDEEEQERLIALTVEVAKGRAPVIAGTGFNSTAHTIHATKAAKKAGADAALVVCPYYNKPTQEGLYQHFKAVHDAVDLPIVIYNIPGRSVVDMSNATMARLAKLPNIVGVKDATNDLARPLKMRVEIGDEFCLLSGEDATAVAYLAQGGAQDQRAYDPAARRAVRRDQPGAGQIRRLAARPLHPGFAPAAVADHAGDAGKGNARDARRRADQLDRWRRIP